jgi:hypothetical protein
MESEKFVTGFTPLRLILTKQIYAEFTDREQVYSKSILINLFIYLIPNYKINTNTQYLKHVTHTRKPTNKQKHNTKTTVTKKAT